jgi:hypothetical protein
MMEGKGKDRKSIAKTEREREIPSVDRREGRERVREVERGKREREGCNIGTREESTETEIERRT